VTQTVGVGTQGLVLGNLSPGPLPVRRALILAASDQQDAATRAAAWRLLEAGDTIICGSLTPPVPVGPRDEVEVDLGPLGRLDWIALAVALAFTVALWRTPFPW